MWGPVVSRRVALVSVCAGLGVFAGSCQYDSFCGFVCPEKGILQGFSTISGVSSIDAFFGAVIDVSAAAARTDAALRGELDAIGVGLGLEPGSSGGMIRAKIEERVEASTVGGLYLRYQPAVCTTSVEVAAVAAAECDIDLDAGEVAVTCEGACDIDASAQADCAADGSLTCVGIAPGLQCAGTCTGSCELSLPATCDGVCRGQCVGECSVVDTQGSCAGACDGDCTGTCELKAGGTCDGACQGECAYAPPGASCEADVQARCEAMAGADVECRGGCEGRATAPTVAAECEATVEAKAKASVDCVPPEVVITWQWSATLVDDLEGQAEFRAWIGALRGRLAGLLAAEAQARALVETAGSLATAAEGAVKDGIEEVRESGDLKSAIGAGCALAVLRDVVVILERVGDDLADSVGGAAEVLIAVGG